ncbi:hypothetical protein WJX72_004651 [[Myrmecia] bisecta]|uniref:Uncharacterized protein n=1 Tax=[Myrmecia] bisecta TaxID=41462 RepID=A0AAW1P820_9CHLO
MRRSAESPLLELPEELQMQVMARMRLADLAAVRVDGYSFANKTMLAAIATLPLRTLSLQSVTCRHRDASITSRTADVGRQRQQSSAGAGLQALTSLRTLDVTDCGALSRQGMQIIGQLTGLRSLLILPTSENGAYLMDDLARLTGLESLRIKPSNSDDYPPPVDLAGLSSLTRLTHLKVGRLSGPTIVVHSLDAITCSLRGLVLGGCAAADGLDSLLTSAALEELALRQCHQLVTLGRCQRIGQLTSLRELSLRGSAMADGFATLTSLQVLDITTGISTLDSAAARHLTRLRSRMELRCHTVDSNTLLTLCRISTLRTLVLETVKRQTPVSAHALAKAQRIHPGLVPKYEGLPTGCS